MYVYSLQAVERELSLGGAGMCFVFVPRHWRRLAPTDYHRFHSPVAGKVVRVARGGADLFTVKVRPNKLLSRAWRCLQNDSVSTILTSFQKEGQLRSRRTLQQCNPLDKCSKPPPRD